MKPPATKEPEMNAIATSIAATLTTALNVSVEVTVAESPMRGLFVSIEGADADLAAVRAFVAEHLSAKLAATDSYPADEDGPAMDFYSVR